MRCPGIELLQFLVSGNGLPLAIWVAGRCGERAQPPVCLPTWHNAAVQRTLQKSIDFTPLLPSAGPTGGCGLAWPAPTMSLTIWSTAPVARAFDIAPTADSRDVSGFAGWNAVDFGRGTSASNFQWSTSSSLLLGRREVPLGDRPGGLCLRLWGNQFSDVSSMQKKKKRPLKIPSRQPHPARRSSSRVPGLCHPCRLKCGFGPCVWDPPPTSQPCSDLQQLGKKRGSSDVHKPQGSYYHISPCGPPDACGGTPRPSGPLRRHPISTAVTGTAGIGLKRGKR